MSKIPKVTIIIANYNGFNDLRICLDSISLLAYRNFETIVFDNCSTDGSCTKIKKRYPWVRLFSFKRNLGFAAGYNRVLKKVTSQFVFLINNDTALPARILNDLTSFAQLHPDVAVLQPKILAYDLPDYFEYAGAAGGFIDFLGYPYCRGRILFTLEKDRGQYNDEIDVFWASGTAMFCRTRILKRAGYFDEDFFAYVEEIDVCWQIHKLKFRVVALTQTFIYHKGAQSWQKYLQQKIFLKHRNLLLVLVKHLSVKRLLLVLPVRLLLDILAIFFYIAEGRFNFVLAVVKAHVMFYIQFPSFWKKRSKHFPSEEAIIEHDLIKPLSILYNYYILKNRMFDQLT